MAAAEEDYYALLGLELTCVQNDIEKAFRKLSSKCHPDKTDDPVKIAKFYRLSKAKEVLLDPKERAAFDEKVKARIQHLKRMEGMEKGRRDMREKLEAREKQAKETSNAAMQEKLSKEAKIQRLREENQSALREMAEKQQQAVEDARKRSASGMSGHFTIKVKWAKKSDVSREHLEREFGRFGAVTDILMSSKKTYAMVVFNEEEAANAAIEKYSNSKVYEVSKVAESSTKQAEAAHAQPATNPHHHHHHQQQQQHQKQDHEHVSNGNASLEDYEQETLRRMLEASKAKKQKQQQQQQQEQNTN